MDKELGMLLGLHCGDALGATLEFKPPCVYPNWHIEITGGGAFNWNAGDATDDTDLMLVVLNSIKNSKTFSLDECTQGLISWLQKNPKDVGNTTRRGIECLMQGKRIQARESDQGNGALMRVTPLALLDLPTEELDNLIKKECELTHAHANCVLANQIFIKLLKVALNSSDRDEVYEAAKKLTMPIPQLHARIQAVPSLPWFDVSASGFVFDGIVCAVWALMNSYNFEDGLVEIVNRGDDSDTNGAITGALLGAFYGAKEIPQRWASKLQYASKIVHLHSKI